MKQYNGEPVEVSKYFNKLPEDLMCEVKRIFTERGWEVVNNATFLVDVYVEYYNCNIIDFLNDFIGYSQNKDLFMSAYDSMYKNNSMFN